MKDNSVLLKSSTEELLHLMGVGATVDVSYDEQNSVYTVNISSDEAAGLLIGKKGETLSSIESVLGIILKSKVGEWFRVSVNIGDYKAKEEDYLKGLARNVVERVKLSGNSENIYNLKSWQRRVIHMYLASEFPEVTSESEGDGEERCLVVKLINS